MNAWRLVRVLAAWLLWAATLSLAHAQAVAPSAVDRLVDRYFDASLAFNPLQATRIGDKRFNDRLPEATSAKRAAQKRLQERYLNDARRLLAGGKTNERDALTLDIFRAYLEQQLRLAAQQPHLVPVTPAGSLPATLAEFGSGLSAQPFNSVRDYEAFARRAKAMPRWVDQAIADMREGKRRGVTLPKVLVERVLPQLDAITEKPLEESIFYRPIVTIPDDFSARDKARLQGEYRTLIQRALNPAYQRLRRFLADEYLPVARNTAGLAAIPGGRARYAELVKYHTTLDVTAEALHTLGQREVERIHIEIAKIRDELGATGSVNEFLREVRKDPALYPFRSAEEIIAQYRDIEARIAPELDKQFRLRPRATLDIQTTPAFRARSASAQYMRPSEDGERPGIFMFPVIEPTRYNRAGMEALFLHEGVPGHHYQLALQQESTLPRFRRHVSFTAYVEGWALYAESLGEELGLYRDAYSRLGRLLGELHRANRLVVDTGLHHYGWSREQAMQWLVDHEGVTMEAAANPIERYMSWPGQALAYKVGELKILELKSRASSTLGERFDVRDFHDEVLREGPMPLALLEQRLTAWIAREASQSR